MTVIFNDNAKTLLSKAASNIDNAMSWMSTPEGNAFWSSVYNKLRALAAEAPEKDSQPEYTHSSNPFDITVDNSSYEEVADKLRKASDLIHEALFTDATAEGEEFWDTLYAKLEAMAKVAQKLASTPQLSISGSIDAVNTVEINGVLFVKKQDDEADED